MDLRSRSAALALYLPYLRADESIPEDLLLVMDAWESLPAAIRAGIVLMVEATIDRVS